VKSVPGERPRRPPAEGCRRRAKDGHAARHFRHNNSSLPSRSPTATSFCRSAACCGPISPPWAGRRTAALRPFAVEASDFAGTTFRRGRDAGGRGWGGREAQTQAHGDRPRPVIVEQPSNGGGTICLFATTRTWRRNFFSRGAKLFQIALTRSAAIW